MSELEQLQNELRNAGLRVARLEQYIADYGKHDTPVRAFVRYKQEWLEDVLVLKAEDGREFFVALSETPAAAIKARDK